MKMGPILCGETWLQIYHSTLRKTPEERRSHQHRGGSLKSSPNNEIEGFGRTGRRSTFPSHSPDLAPSDFHHFGRLKPALRDRHFADDDEFEHSVHEELRGFSEDFWATGCSVSRKGETCVDNEGDFVQK
jgi:hypothetical protein